MDLAPESLLVAVKDGALVGHLAAPLTVEVTPRTEAVRN
jgi:hypothetical protein